MEKENIFAGCGKIVTKDLYIHRRELEQALLGRVSKNNHGSVSIVGMPRMGKSSLVYNTIVAHADDFYKENIIVVNIQMDTFSNPVFFLKNLADSVYDMLDEYNNADIKIQRKYEKVKESAIEDGVVKKIQVFFRTLLKEGKRVICVIDEFDHARKLFEKFPEGFSILRELAYQPDTDVTFIFVSRRMITELESISDISTLANILGNPIYVPCYSEDEIGSYYTRNEKYGITLDIQEKADVLKLTGSQPYWMDLLFKNYIKKINENNTLMGTFDNISGTLYDEYDGMLAILKEQKLENKLYQIIFGPADDYTFSDVQKLMDYGIIKIINDKATIFSEKLYDYMKLCSQSVNFYPLWNETEHLLRRMLKSCLEKKHGQMWESKLEEYQSINIKTDKCKTIGAYITEAIGLKSKVSTQPRVYKKNMNFTVVEGLTTAGIFSIFNYEVFYKDIIKDKTEFDRIARHICKARNPYQHNNDDFLDHDFKEQTKIYCKFLNKKITDWLQKNFSKR